MVYIIGGEPVDPKENILNAIKEDLTLFRKNGDQNGLYAAGLLLGEIQRDPDKDTSDKNVTKILKKLRKVTMKLYEAAPFDPEGLNKDFLIIQLIDTYIPPPVPDNEVMEWATSKYSAEDIKSMGKAAFSIIGEAKKHFGDRDFDTNSLKESIEEILNEE